MSLSSSNNRNDYVGNGAASSYDYTYRIISDSDLKVTVRDTDGVESTLTLTTDYTVSGAGDENGGSISLVDSSQTWLTEDGNLKDSYAITIRRKRPLTQTTDIRNQGSFFPETHEDAFDHFVMIDQQQQDDIDRSVKLPETVSDSGFDPSLPSDIADSAGKVLIVNTDGDGFSLSDVSELVNLDGALAIDNNLSDLDDADTALTNLGLTATATELNYVDGVTSAIQTQLDAKASTTDLTTHEADTSTHGVTGDILGTGDILDEDDMSSDSATKVPSQQSTKAYVDTSLTTHEADTSTHGVTGDIVGTTDAQTLSAKEFSDELTFAQITTPSDPATGKNKLYPKDDNKFYTLDSDGNEVPVGSGSGSGVKTFIDNGDFESAIDTDKVFTYDDGTDYVDGAGGTPDAITIARNSTTPLAGSHDLKISKSANDCTGQGVTLLSETIDRAQRGNVLFAKFQYDFSDTNYTSGDIQLKAYDVTNSKELAVIPFSGLDDDGGLLKAQTQGIAKIYTSDTTASIRISLHCESDSATSSTWDGFIDEVTLGPEGVAPGPFMSEWQDFPDVTAGGTAASPGAHLISGVTTAPTFTTTTTNRAMWRRDGPDMLIAWDIVLGSGSAGSGKYVLNLPPGYSIDTDKVTVYTGSSGTAVPSGSLGVAKAADASNAGIGRVYAYSSTQLSVFFDSIDPLGSNGFWGSSIYSFGSATSFHLTARVPISGWKASASIGTNELALTPAKVSAAISTSSHTSSGNWQDVAWTESVDNSGSFDGTEFTAKKPIRLHIHGSITFGGSSTGKRGIGFVKNSDTVQIVTMLYPTGVDAVTYPFSFDVALDKDDTFKIQAFQNSGGSLSYNSSSRLYIDEQPSLSAFTAFTDTTDVELFLSGGNGEGSTNTGVRRFTTEEKNTLGNYATYADSAADGMSVTIHVPGVYAISYSDFDDDSAIALGATVNSTTLTGFPTTYATGQRGEINTSTNIVGMWSKTLRLKVGDVVRAQVSNSADGTVAHGVTFQMTRVGD